MNKKLFYYLIFTGALILLVAWLIKSYPTVLQQDSTRLHLISSLIILAYLGLHIFSRRFQVKQAVKDALVWVGIGAMLLIGYQYKDQLKEQLFPTKGQQHNGGEVRFRLSDNNHFFIDARLNGYPVRFLVDSGASRVIVSRSIAEKTGIVTEGLTFNQPTMTANGLVMSAPVKFGKLEVGPIVLYDVAGAVVENNLNEPLLGMSFLNRLSSWRVEGDTLILKQ
jgi:aspartyl protease family protein